MLDPLLKNCPGKEGTIFTIQIYIKHVQFKVKKKKNSLNIYRVINYLCSSRLINEEMDNIGLRAKAFKGIACKSDFISVGNNIFMVPMI